MKGLAITSKGIEETAYTEIKELINLRTYLPKNPHKPHTRSIKIK